MNTIKHTLTINLGDDHNYDDVLRSMVEENDGRAMYTLAEAIIHSDVEITIKDGKVTAHRV